MIKVKAEVFFGNKRDYLRDTDIPLQCTKQIIEGNIYADNANYHSNTNTYKIGNILYLWRFS